MSGLLTLDYSLRQHGSKYPLVALYTDTLEPEGLAGLDARGIPKRRVNYLLPSVHKDYSNEVRFYDCWSKLTPFSLVEFERVVQLDSDMLVLRNMDELMELELDPPSLEGRGERVFAASHACVCNPLGLPHYPKDWIPTNCAFTSQHDTPELAQVEGAPPSTGAGIINGGLQVVNPSTAVYNLILARLSNPSGVSDYEFADQSLLSDLFKDRWVSLPYVYNALKTLRWPGVHKDIWMDGNVKNIHYILNPKPWDKREGGPDEPHDWWWSANDLRLAEENARGIATDGF
ncbi:hypothetical protein GP486_001594 [Trichoglossum hirsutum]|uniref:Glycosyl transferase family protein n=1 Tax=Trichoglossum hirsutum TaxID=265104 RepID=A0A9P8LGW2_9PEZI|nr:hypothetical protein GP486_001594 [Trichoglossum hirsutum]